MGMVEMKFSGTSMENLHRQIVKYAEWITGLQMVDRPGKHQMGTKNVPVDQPRPVVSESDGPMVVGYQYKK